LKKFIKSAFTDKLNINSGCTPNTACTISPTKSSTQKQSLPIGFISRRDKALLLMKDAGLEDTRFNKPTIKQLKACLNRTNMHNFESKVYIMTLNDAEDQPFNTDGFMNIQDQQFLNHYLLEVFIDMI